MHPPYRLALLTLGFVSALAVNAQTATSSQSAEVKRALELVNTGRPSLAIPTLEAAARIEPSNTHVLYTLGLAQAKTGSLPAAIGTFQQTVKLAEQSGQSAPLAHNALGWTYFLDGQPSLAKRSLIKGLDSAGHDKEAATKILNNLGMVHMALGEYDQSAASFQRANALSSSDFSRRNLEIALKLKDSTRSQGR